MLDPMLVRVAIGISTAHTVHSCAIFNRPLQPQPNRKQRPPATPCDGGRATTFVLLFTMMVGYDFNPCKPYFKQIQMVFVYDLQGFQPWLPAPPLCGILTPTDRSRPPSHWTAQVQWMRRARQAALVRERGCKGLRLWMA